MIRRAPTLCRSGSTRSVTAVLERVRLLVIFWMEEMDTAPVVVMVREVNSWLEHVSSCVVLVEVMVIFPPFISVRLVSSAYGV